jgi:fused signal recognition particle receptor
MRSFLKSTKEGWATRLKQGLTRTRERMGRELTGLFSRHTQVDESLFEDLETVLITCDVGVPATEHLLKEVRAQVRRRKLAEPEEVRVALKSALLELLQPLAVPLEVDSAKPFVIMVAGVNGSGKTTTIGKLAKHFQNEGCSVMLAAGDTFRAAAREQLKIWGDRNAVPVISQESGDAAAVIFDAIQSARARGIDVLIADTAGRLPTQLHLMEEIKKVKRVIAKAMPESQGTPAAPHEVLLVLDANTGQNALSQVKAFDQALGVTGLILTKLDGTAKGGVIAAIAKAHPIPVRFIGVGEGLDDLRPFVAEEFVAALLGMEE